MVLALAPLLQQVVLNKHQGDYSTSMAFISHLGICLSPCEPTPWAHHKLLSGGSGTN
uniref:Uncharacterized protein n=1 Tax=Rhizophora mucronata TaxID=61149 RepID=A0A2P2QSA2_RHIMU